MSEKSKCQREIRYANWFKNVERMNKCRLTCKLYEESLEGQTKKNLIERGRQDDKEKEVYVTTTECGGGWS